VACASCFVYVRLAVWKRLHDQNSVDTSVPSSWGAHILLFQLPKRNLTLNIEADEQSDLQIVFEQVEAYKCTYYFARTEEMLIAYDRIVDLGETSWLIEVRNRVREHPGLSSPSGPPDQLLHLMINFDDGPCYEFICQSFGVAQIPTDPERWNAERKLEPNV
jgi:hypothetical protein